MDCIYRMFISSHDEADNTFTRQESQEKTSCPRGQAGLPTQPAPLQRRETPGRSAQKAHICPHPEQTSADASGIANMLQNGIRPLTYQHLVFSGGCQAVLWACQSVFAFDMGSVVSCGRSHLQLIAYTFFGTPASKVFTLYAKSEAIQVVGITSLLLCG